MLVRRNVRCRNVSSSPAGLPLWGDRGRCGQGEDGAGLQARAYLRACFGGFRACSFGIGGTDGRGECHALLDAGAEVRAVLLHEGAVDAPDLVRLHDAEGLAPVVESFGGNR